MTRKLEGILTFKRALLFCIAILIIFTLTLLIFRNDPPLKLAFSDILTPLINLFAVICLLHASKFSKVYGKRVYYAWLILAIGQLFFVLGDISWAYIELYLNQSPIFSLADIFYLAYYPIFALGIFLLPRTRFNRLYLGKIILDISIVGITMGVLLWAFLINPLFVNVDGNLESAYVSLSYVILDLVLLFALLDMVYNRIGDLKIDPLFLLAAGILVQIISDIIFIYQTGQGTFSSGSLLDIGWIIGFLLIGLAGILQSENAIEFSRTKKEIEAPQNRSEWSSYIPFLWVVFTYVIFAWGYRVHKIENFESIIWMGVLILILLLIRQIISFKEISQLYNAAENEISKRKVAEQVLKRERDKAQMYLDIAGVIIIVLDNKQDVILINKKGCEVLGRPESDIIGKKWVDNFIPHENVTEVRNILNKIISGKYEGYAHNENPILTKTGEKRIISWSNSLMYDNKGNIIGLISSGEDITQKRIEEELKEKNIAKTIKRQKALLNLSRKDISELKIFLMDLTEVDSHILDVERVSVWFFDDEMTQIHCRDLYTASNGLHQEGTILKADSYPHYFKAIQELHSITARDAQNDPHTSEFTESYLKPLGIVSLMDTPIWLKGKLIGVVCHEHVGGELREWTLEEQDFASSIANMVSLSLEADEHRKAQEKIKESLQEKEVLLKEIHHRVKNNMQIISSLLNLQARKISDPEIAEIFKESQSRVKSMSMIHERLYQSKTLSHIDFSEYINSLSLDLLRTYASNPDMIELKINAEKVKINIDTAIPCGLILTELVSNAFKYAFPDGRKGEINIDFSKKGDLFTLKISDNGVGIPEGLDYAHSKTLGILLVNSLIDQIDGKIDMNTSDGTSFTITFKEVNYEDRI